MGLNRPGSDGQGNRKKPLSFESIDFTAFLFRRSDRKRHRSGRTGNKQERNRKGNRGKVNANKKQAHYKKRCNPPHFFCALFLYCEALTDKEKPLYYLAKNPHKRGYFSAAIAATLAAGK